MRAALFDLLELMSTGSNDSTELEEEYDHMQTEFPFRQNTREKKNMDDLYRYRIV